MRVEYLLMHEFFKYNYIIPDKIRLWEGPGGDKHKGAKYEGGYVLEPKVGLHQNYTLLLDFKSLYPSIIRRYNLCFTTVKREFVPMKFYTDPKVRNEIIEKSPDPSVMVTNHNPPVLNKKQAEEKGTYILPYILEDLVEKRDYIKSEIKKLRKTPTSNQSQKKEQQEKIEACDIKQLAVKVVANSIYGSLGFKTSRFYSKDIAAMVTFYGRNVLKKTIEVVEQEQYEVLYGDTDSVMVNSRVTDWKQAM